LKPKILIYTDWFPPAFKAGGPIQSIYQLTQLLKEEYEIYVFSTTEDLNEDIEDQLSLKNQFVLFDGIQVIYLDSFHRSLTHIKRLSDAIQPQFVFFNGLFNKYFSKYLLYHFSRNPNVSSIISLRGMLKSSALEQKERKKKIYIRILRWLISSKNVTFHCTSKDEESDLIKNFGEKQNSVVLPNIPFLSQEQIKHNKTDELKLVYAARIHPIKNLGLIISILPQVKSSLKLTIIGVVEDEEYWLKCKKQFNQLPKHIKVEVLGDMKHHELMNNLPNYDVYVLPTLGENFGHSIFEALSAGLPVIISDQTPWRNLTDHKVGFDIPLFDDNSIVLAIEKFAAMSQKEFFEWSKSAKDYALNYYNSQHYLKEYKSLFSYKIKVGIVAPVPLERYKGGISNFAEIFMQKASEFEDDGIQFSLINTCIIPRTNESTGRFEYSNFKNYFLFIYLAFKQIKRDKIEILHIHTSVGKSIFKDSIPALLFKWILGTKNILHLHVGEVSQVQIKGVLKKMNEWLLGNAYHRVLVLSPQLKNLFKPKLKGRVLMICNFHNSDVIQDKIKQANDKIFITFIGSISESKGVLDLFEALSKLNDKNWCLNIAGDFINNDFKKKVMQFPAYISIKNNVNFLGYINNDYKHNLLNNNDILVLPSYAEGMPFSLLEAISYGNAIVTTNVGANQTHFSSICNLLQPGDIIGLKSELSELLNDIKLLNKRKNQARELAHRFTFDAFKEQITPIYKTI
jgi:glycosyltransferase involved in cell wall biosynthesis